MTDNIKFSLQVITLFVLTFAVTFWLLNDAPTVRMVAKPIKPNPNVPTFADTVAKKMKTDINGNLIDAGYVRTRELKSVGYTIVTGAPEYEENECNSKTRKYIIGRINHFAMLRHRHPHLELSRSGEVTDNTVEDAINNLFLGGLLTIDEFSGATRSWLKDFARSGTDERAHEIRQCQSKPANN